RPRAAGGAGQWGCSAGCPDSQCLRRRQQPLRSLRGRRHLTGLRAWTLCADTPEAYHLGCGSPRRHRTDRRRFHRPERAAGLRFSNPWRAAAGRDLRERQACDSLALGRTRLDRIFDAAGRVHPSVAHGRVVGFRAPRGGSMPYKQSALAAVMATVLAATVLAALAGRARAAAIADPNPYLWLAQIHGKKALAWVEVQNGRSDLELEGDATYARDRAQIMDVLNADTRIPEGELDHGWVLNFWQSADHVRGIWRRTSIAEYARKAPHWQTLLDVDEL